MKIRLLSESLQILKCLDNSFRQFDIPLDTRFKLWYNIFIQQTKPSCNVIKSKIDAKKDTIIDQFMGLDTVKLKQLPNSDVLLKSNKTKNDIIEWILSNHTEIRLNQIFSLDRGDDHLSKLLYNNPFVPLNSIIYLEKNILIRREILWKGVRIICFEKKELVDLHELVRIVDAIRIIAKKPNANILIIAALTPFKKQLYDPDKLTPISINSGSSYAGHYINLWRYEELYKVLIHELIHFLGLDFTISPSIETLVRGVFEINGECRPNEAYTETIAVILHCCYLASRATRFDFINRYIMCEINFSITQCKRILDITNSKTYTDLKITQTTDVVSYFLIKTAFLLNLKLFLNFLQDDLSFNKKFRQYEQLIRICLPSLRCIDNAIPIELNTLRMTCLQTF